MATAVGMQQALQAYRQAKGMGESMKSGAGASDGASVIDGGNAFAQLVKHSIGSAEGSIKTGEAMSMKAITGKAELADVVTAVADAELTLQTVVAVRDRVINAYQEILKMPI